MHVLQQRILNLVASVNIKSLSLREIGSLVQDDHPQKIKHHVDQLFKKGFLIDDGIRIIRVGLGESTSFYSLPIMELADCGQILTVSNENIKGYLTLSKSMLTEFKLGSTIAIRYIGNSMNRANINGLSVFDRDFIIVNTDRANISDCNGKYVFTTICGVSCIKKLIIETSHHRLTLISESSDDYPPIYIHENDLDEFSISGVAIDVIPKSD